MVISMLKIRRPLGRLIFNMGIAIPGKTVFLIETAPRCLVENEDVVGAAPTGDAPFTSEWSIIWLPTKAQLILEV